MNLRTLVIIAPVLMSCLPAPLLAQVQGAWTSTGAMQTARQANVQLKLSTGNVLSIGGVDANGLPLASAEMYNSKKFSWAPIAPMLTARDTFAAVVLKTGKVLVTGGAGSGTAALSAVELFDPKTNSWTAAASLALGRYGHTATLLPNGTVLVAGGCTASGCATVTGESEIYNPTKNTWTVTGSLATPRYLHNAVLLKSGSVLAIGGYGGGATTEIYAPATASWTPAASLTATRYQSAATLLPDGKVLVTGGVVTKYPINSAELYDPASDSWTLTGNMHAGHYAHTATLLPDGTVVVAGGFGQSISCGKACTGFIPFANSELFTESTGSFAATTPLVRALAYHTTTLLGSGQALTSGGTGLTGTCCVTVPDAELYTPLTLSFSAVSLNFGFLQLGLTSAVQTITVTNASPHNSVFQSIAASGDFAQTNDCPTTLLPGEACTLSVSFTPTASGARAGTVTLTDNDPGSPKQIIPVFGTGETLALAFSPASLNLGSVPATTSSILTSTLVNDGAAAVTINGATISPGNGTFKQTNDCPATLAAQQSCTVTITFTPPDVLKYKAALSVTNSAGAAASLALSGTGLDAP